MKKIYFLRMVFGPIAIYALVVHILGTISTNISPLAAKYPGSLSKHMAIGMALSIAMPFFLSYKNYAFRLLCSFAIMLSSVLAINTMQTKEIVGLEDRIKNDEEYNQLYCRWENLEKQYTDAQSTVLKYLDLEIKTDKNWSEGAKSARIDRSRLLAEKDTAWTKVELRKQELKQAGSQSNEAYVRFFASILPFSSTTIENGSLLMTSFVNDLGIILYSSVIVFLFGKWVIIPVPKALRKRSDWFNNLLKNSVILQRLFSYKPPRRHLASKMIRGINAIKESRKEFPDKLQVELCYISAEKINRRKKDGSINEFSPGFVSDVLRGEYDNYLPEEG